MHPPILQCVTGHSICSACTPKLRECPNCKANIRNTQNFALEQIVNHVNYPCKYDGCRFYTTGNNIKNHEETCVHGTFDCLLKEYIECHDEIKHSEMHAHISTKHYENLLDNDGVTYPIEEDQDFEDSVIVRYGLKLFQMHFAYDDGNFYWYVQLFGPAEESKKYRFEIDIRDNNGGNCRIYMIGRCGVLTLKSKLRDLDMSTNCIFLQYDQVKHLLTSHINFDIRIVEN